MTFDCFHSVGNFPLAMDLLKILHSDLATIDAASFKRRQEMLSSPVDLLVFKLESRFWTVSGLVSWSLKVHFEG